MHTNIICGGCKIEESTTKHTLECTILVGSNELVTYIPDIQDLYGDDEDEQVYIARILKDNIRRLPELGQSNEKDCHLGPCEPASVFYCTCLYSCGDTNKKTKQ